MKIAVIGSGISGLASAYLAQHNKHEVHLFENADYFGGHSNTIMVDEGKNSFPVDTGFLVHNPKTYPNLIQMFAKLDVKTVDTQMTLSVQVPEHNLEWGGSNLATVFGQKRNLLRPSFYRMLIDILNFNKRAPEYLKECALNRKLTLGELIKKNSYSDVLRDWYLVPMAAAIWSTPANEILDFPAFSFLQFCLNHNLFQVQDRPTWRTVLGGSKVYVKKITDTIEHKYLQAKIQNLCRKDNKVHFDCVGKNFIFDHVIFANHPDQILKLITDPNPEEKNLLSMFRYQKNLAIVHSDESFLPERKALWSAWNYVSSPKSHLVSVSYLINALQPLPSARQIIVTLNPHKEVAKDKIIKEIEYEHPFFDNTIVEAQKNMESLQGQRGFSYAGAWLGYGFHEDGLKSALRVARSLKWEIPWNPVYE